MYIPSCKFLHVFLSCNVCCSFWKRQTEVASRWSYIEQAYMGLKRWVATGDEDQTRLKRYILRHLDIPPRESGFTNAKERFAPPLLHTLTSPPHHHHHHAYPR